MNTDDLPIAEFDLKLAEMILATPAPGKHAARSAILHIKRGWMLRAIDKEMAVFHALTGEEESVTAIFHSLIRLKYRNAEKLKYRNHVHKAALQPFLAAIENNFHAAGINQFKPVLNLDESQETPKLTISITLTFTSGQQVAVSPDSPLDFSVDHNGKPYDYSDELLELTKQPNLEKVYRHVQDLANRRNQLLYASQQGIPTILESVDNLLLKRRDRIFRNIALYLLIDSYGMQSFIQQALEAFLQIVRSLPKESED